MFTHPVYLQRIRVKFAYECHHVKVLVRGWSGILVIIIIIIITGLYRVVLRQQTCIREWKYYVVGEVNGDVEQRP